MTARILLFLFLIINLTLVRAKLSFRQKYLHMGTRDYERILEYTDTRSPFTYYPCISVYLILTRVFNTRVY